MNRTANNRKQVLRAIQDYFLQKRYTPKEVKKAKALLLADVRRKPVKRTGCRGPLRPLSSEQVDR